MGRWPDKDSIKKYAGIYYPAWIKRMQDHGLRFYTAVGDHEIGDNPWRGDKAELVSYFKRQFQSIFTLLFPMHNEFFAEYCLPVAIFEERQYLGQRHGRPSFG